MKYDISSIVDRHMKTMIYYLIKGSEDYLLDEEFGLFLIDEIVQYDSLISTIENEPDNLASINLLLDNSRKIDIDQDDFYSNIKLLHVFTKIDADMLLLLCDEFKGNNKDIPKLYRKIQNGLLHINHAICNYFISKDQEKDEFSYDKRYMCNTIINSILGDWIDFWFLIDLKNKSKNSKKNTVHKYECKIIKSYISFIKFIFSIKWVMQSPFYDERFKEILHKLYIEIRELMYNAIIGSFFIEFIPINNENSESRGAKDRTTRILIRFMLNDAKCFELRIDFPHKGVNFLHINLEDERGEYALPINRNQYLSLKEKLHENKIIDTLFYEAESKFWFTSQFIKNVDKLEICDNDIRIVKKIYNERSHLKLDSSIPIEELSAHFDEFNIVLSYILSSEYEPLRGRKIKDDVKLESTKKNMVRLFKKTIFEVEWKSK